MKPHAKNYCCFSELAVENGGRLDFIASGAKQDIQSPSYPNMVLPGLREVWVIRAEGLRKVISVQVRHYVTMFQLLLRSVNVMLMIFKLCLEKYLQLS